MQTDERSLWDDGPWYDSILEANLAQSIENARRDSLPRVSHAAHKPVPIGGIGTEQDGVNLTGSTGLSQQVAGCGIAVIDGYLTIKDYAAERGLDLVELHHKGIDLQDLISTLLIGLQYESRDTGARRFKR
jgi:hypothetical protein